MRLHHFSLTKAQLDAIPEKERTLLVLFAHAANELSILTKLFHFAAAGDTEVPVLMEARNAQALALGRLLTGKLYECWSLLQRAFFAAQLSRVYDPLFDAAAKDAITALRKYFGKTNLIETVRNKFAFHYSPQQIKEGYKALAEGDVLDVYLSHRNANTLYVFAESIAGRSLLGSINSNDHQKAMDSLIMETSRAVDWFNTVVGAYMSNCLKLHVGGDLYSLGAREMDIEGAPDWRGIALPYFVEIAENGEP